MKLISLSEVNFYQYSNYQRNPNIKGLINGIQVIRQYQLRFQDFRPNINEIYMSFLGMFKNLEHFSSTCFY